MQPAGARRLPNRPLPPAFFTNRRSRATGLVATLAPPAPSRGSTKIGAVKRRDWPPSEKGSGPPRVLRRLIGFGCTAWAATVEGTDRRRAHDGRLRADLTIGVASACIVLIDEQGLGTLEAAPRLDVGEYIEVEAPHGAELHVRGDGPSVSFALDVREPGVRVVQRDYRPGAGACPTATSASSMRRCRGRVSESPVAPGGTCPVLRRRAFRRLRGRASRVSAWGGVCVLLLPGPTEQLFSSHDSDLVHAAAGAPSGPWWGSHPGAG